MNRTCSKCDRTARWYCQDHGYTCWKHKCDRAIHIRKCTSCNGSGFHLHEHKETGEQVEVECRKCHGTGTTPKRDRKPKNRVGDEYADSGDDS